jgi:hypothetical protein
LMADSMMSELGKNLAQKTRSWRFVSGGDTGTGGTRGHEDGGTRKHGDGGTRELGPGQAVVSLCVLPVPPVPLFPCSPRPRVPASPSRLFGTWRRKARVSHKIFPEDFPYEF